MVTPNPLQPELCPGTPCAICSGIEVGNRQGGTWGVSLTCHPRGIRACSQPCGCCAIGSSSGAAPQPLPPVLSLALLQDKQKTVNSEGKNPHHLQKNDGDNDSSHPEPSG